jgi:hypothetical protein
VRNLDSWPGATSEVRQDHQPKSLATGPKKDLWICESLQFKPRPAGFGCPFRSRVPLKQSNFVISHNHTYRRTSGNLALDVIRRHHNCGLADYSKW